MINSAEEEITKRDQWTGRLDFILSCVGFAVGLGNIWRFPYLCYKNGGGSFFIPYFLALICGGIPVFILEISLGQYMSLGGLEAWDICPAFRGIGYAALIIGSLLNIYYIVVLAWDVTYMALSFSSVLPYSHCNNWWNTDKCYIPNPIITSDQLMSNATETYNEGDLSILYQVNVTTKSNLSRVDPVVEFWEKRVLQISEGINEPNGLVLDLSLSLFFVWVLCYFCIFKGIKWSGKVVYFTAIFPYVILFALLIRALTLDGATEGLKYLFSPDFTRLADAQVWIDAGTQIFFSYAIGLGALIALGSYNKFHNNCYRDCIVISCINSGTSILSGVVIFSVLGFMAKQQGVSIDEVAESGPGLAFIAYPKAVTQMPIAPLWAFLFYFMILLVGLGSQFVGVEGVITILMDMFPNLKKGHRRELVVAVYSMISFIIGLSMVSRGGMYVFQLFDYFAASGMSLLWVATAECLAIAWVFGVNHYYDCLEVMLGFRINGWLKLCWKVLTPLLMMFIFLWMWVQFSFPKYNKVYEYPVWARVFGLSLAFLSMISIPVYFIYSFLTASGKTLRQRWNNITTPIIKPERIPPHWQEAPELCAHYSNRMTSSTGVTLRFFNRKQHNDKDINYSKVTEQAIHQA